MILVKPINNFHPIPPIVHRHKPTTPSRTHPDIHLAKNLVKNSVDEFQFKSHQNTHTSKIITKIP